MSTTKQVKVDNWGIFFLQRLKHFFNRTDYCDLTLQFQENAQLKVHRLVLNACTEYFELLERTCEMYEDCLIMPDDLQADVVVPIVNFMYTGQLEYKQHLFDRLYQTAQVMNMTVLTKLLDAQRVSQEEPVRKITSQPKNLNQTLDKIPPTMSKKVYIPSRKTAKTILANSIEQQRRFQASMATSPIIKDPSEFIPVEVKKEEIDDSPRPTRYELPAELDNELLYENSFSDISYDTVPILRSSNQPVQEDNEPDLFSDTPDEKPFDTLGTKRTAQTNFVANAKKRSKLFNDNQFNSVMTEAQETIPDQGSGNIVEHIIEKNGAKVTIETKTTCGNSAEIPEVDHFKIINEVLKRNPHLANSNIKLKIVTNGQPNQMSAQISKSSLPQTFSPKSSPSPSKPIIMQDNDFAYVTDVTDTKAAAKLVALGADNVNGPWICLICATPGKALNFPTYYRFRRHLLDVHKEKPPHNLCEHCGLKSNKRNHMVHHLYVQHDIPPPPSYRFPKCDKCQYIALNETLLTKHKNSHLSAGKSFVCNVCLAPFVTSRELLHHIQNTGHKISPERRTSYKCIYCAKMFLRETNLYSHVKLTHKRAAQKDGIIDNSDEELDEDIESPIRMKNEVTSEDEYADNEYQIEQSMEGNISLTTKKRGVKTLLPSQQRHILNPQFQKSKRVQVLRPSSNSMEESNVDDSPSNHGKVVILSQSTFMLNNNAKSGNLSYNNDQFTQSNINRGQIMSNSQRLMKNSSNTPYEIIISDPKNYNNVIDSEASIIFEDTENSQINNQSMDIDNDNVMILQPEYANTSHQDGPISNSSNIVVVYSQPLGSELIVPESITNQGFAQSQQEYEEQENIGSEETVSTWQPEEEVSQGSELPENEETNVEKLTQASGAATLARISTDNYEHNVEPSNEALSVEAANIQSEADGILERIHNNIVGKSKQTKNYKRAAKQVKISDPEIQNLTSEWTDDEDPKQDEETEILHQEDITEETVETLNESTEIEESIENIREEVNKQVCTDENQSDAMNGEPVENVTIEPRVNGDQQKVEVSTILNDWDESEEQEDDSINESQDPKSDENEENAVKETETNVESDTQRDEQPQESNE